MDKRRNHIIFWVVFYIYNVVGNYSVTYGFRTIIFTTIMTFVTTVVSVLIFYSFTYYIFPHLFSHKKHFILIVYLVVFGIVTLIFYYFIMLTLSKYFPYTITGIIIERIIPYYISRYISTLYIAFSYWYLKVYKENAEKERLMISQKNALIKSVNQAELSSLTNQINPHFLYNTLNFFYAQALTISTKLANSILILSSMMRYSIRERNEGGAVALEKEINYMKNYANLDNLKTNSNAGITFILNGNLQYRRIKSLILLPFIEFVCNSRNRDNNDSIYITVVENSLLVHIRYFCKKDVSDKAIKKFVKNYEQILFKEYETKFRLLFEPTKLHHLIELKIIL